MITDARKNTNSVAPGIERLRWTLVLLVIALAWILGPNADIVRGQDNPLESIGIPQLRSQIPVPNGLVDTANGNLHLEIPLGGSAPQRGNPPHQLTLTYDSNIYAPNAWTAFGPNSQTFINQLDPGTSYPYLTGWRVAEAMGGIGSTMTAVETCPYDGFDLIDGFSYWSYQSPDGAVHTFNSVYTQVGYNDSPTCWDETGSTISTSDSVADDGSGYHLYVTGVFYGYVYAPDGTLVGVPTYMVNVMDTNGNYINGTAMSSGSEVDTLGRSTTASLSGNTLTISVPNSQGSTSNYVLYCTPLKLDTSFR